MFGLPERIVIFDLECWTDEGVAARSWSGPGESRELIQLGAALVETESFTELDSRMWLVKPERHPVLPQYFINLTHITQEVVDEKGIRFPYFLREFFDFCQSFQLYCFDKIDRARLFDRDVLVENCELHGIEFPFEMKRFHNINKIFHQHGVAVKQSGAAPEAFGMELPARPHDALNDVRGLIIGLQALSERLRKS